MCVYNRVCAPSNFLKGSRKKDTQNKQNCKMFWIAYKHTGFSHSDLNNITKQGFSIFKIFDNLIQQPRAAACPVVAAVAG